MAAPSLPRIARESPALAYANCDEQNQYVFQYLDFRVQHGKVPTTNILLSFVIVAVIAVHPDVSLPYSGSGAK